MADFFGTLFGFEAGKHSVRTEIVAGITTFLTMAYILARCSSASTSSSK